VKCIEPKDCPERTSWEVNRSQTSERLGKKGSISRFVHYPKGANAIRADIFFLTSICIWSFLLCMKQLRYILQTIKMKGWSIHRGRARGNSQSLLAHELRARALVDTPVPSTVEDRRFPWRHGVPGPCTQRPFDLADYSPWNASSRYSPH
jgi:hypothetical protein